MSIDTWNFDYRRTCNGFPDAETRRSYTEHTGLAYDHALVCKLFKQARMRATCEERPRDIDDETAAKAARASPPAKPLKQLGIAAFLHKPRTEECWSLVND